MKLLWKYLLLLSIITITINAYNPDKNNNINNKEKTYKQKMKTKNNKKLKLVVMNKEIFDNTGGLYGKSIIYVKNKKEALKKINEITNNVKSIYMNFSLIVSLIFTALEIIKLNSLHNKHQILTNNNPILFAKKINLKLYNIKKDIKNEIISGLIILIVINLFSFYMIYHYLENLSFFIIKN